MDLEPNGPETSESFVRIPSTLMCIFIYLSHCSRTCTIVKSFCRDLQKIWLYTRRFPRKRAYRNWTIRILFTYCCNKKENRRVLFKWEKILCTK